METITINALQNYRLRELRQEVRTAFGSRFKDFNEVAPNRFRVYLLSKQIGDDTLLAGIAQAHDPAAIDSAVNSDRLSRRNRKRALLTKLGMDVSDFRALRELIQDGNSD